MAEGDAGCVEDIHGINRYTVTTEFIFSEPCVKLKDYVEK